MPVPRRPVNPLPGERLATTLRMLGGPGTTQGRTKQAQKVPAPRPGQRTPDRNSRGPLAQGMYVDPNAHSVAGGGAVFSDPGTLENDIGGINTYLDYTGTVLSWVFLKACWCIAHYTIYVDGMDAGQPVMLQANWGGWGPGHAFTAVVGVATPMNGSGGTSGQFLSVVTPPFNPGVSDGFNFSTHIDVGGSGTEVIGAGSAATFTILGD